MAAPPTDARLARLANHAGATTYRWGTDRQIEHRCVACRRWLPATPEHFSAGSRDLLQARCRRCFGLLTAAPRPEAARRAAERLDAQLLDERRCRCCGERYALVPELWAAGADGTLLHVCALCTYTLRARVAARGRTRMEGAHDVV